MLDNEIFIKTMTGLCEIYGKNPSEYIFEIYYEIFKDYDINQFNSAVTKCIKSNKYNVLPKPAEILEYLEGDKNDKALFAWIQAKEGVQKCGYYDTPHFTDPIISHCIEELGGWMKFCSCDIEELKFIEKRFTDLYRLFLKRDITERKKLLGFSELKNANGGFDEPKNIVKIGSESRKLLINGEK